MLRAFSFKKPTESRVKVSPVVACKTETTEVTTMAHYVIEFSSESDIPEQSIHRPVSGGDLAVGVMG